jgi:hypothetical protein
MPETIDDTDAIPFAGLTKKQTVFVDAVISSGFEHGSIIAAYRSAYNWTGQDNGASVEAWKLLRSPKIAQRIRDASNAQGATTDRLIAGILSRTENTDHDQTALNGYELLAKITGLLNPAPAATASATSYQQTNISVTAGALSEILSMLDAAPGADGEVKVIDGQSGT